MTTSYIIKNTLSDANDYNDELTTRILAALERSFTRYTYIVPYPTAIYTGTGEVGDPWVYISGDQRCLLAVDEDFDVVATTEELALKKTRAQVEALGWFPPEEE